MTPEITCATCRARLPEYVNGRLAPDERASVERHLATCAACQAEAHAWRIIAGVVRGTDAVPAPEVPLGASLAQVRARLAMRAQVATPKGSTHMPDTNSKTSSVPPRAYPITATVLLIVIISVLVFAFTHAHNMNMNEPNASGACDATHSGTGLSKYNSITAIDMTSATTGWAVGFTEDPAHSTVLHSLILRYQRCRWMAFGNATDDDTLATLSMGSDADGWAAGLHASPGALPTNITSYLLHYTQGQWQRVALPAVLPANSEVVQIQMISPDEGWLIAVSFQPRHPGYFLFHYLHGTWNVALTTTNTQNLIQVAAVAPDDCLVLERDQERTSVIIHYHQGMMTRWSAPSEVRLTAITLVSPGAGYALGNTFTTFTQNVIIEVFNGTTWTQHLGPQIAPDQYAFLGSIAALPGRIWFSATTTMDEPHASTVWVGGPDAWQQQHLVDQAHKPGPLAIYIDPLSSTDVWAIAQQESQTSSISGHVRGVLWHYQNGQWVNVEG